MAHLTLIEFNIEARMQKLQQESGYPVNNLKYFRRIGPLASYIPKPTRGTEIYISKLPPDVYGDEIFWTFSKIGQIYDLRLMLRPSGLANRGFCFVRYFNVEDARNAQKEFDSYELEPGIRISVMMSLQNNKLNLHGLPTGKTKRDVLEMLTLKGIVGIVDVQFDSSLSTDYYSGGLVDVEFETHGKAATAKKRFGKSLILWGKPIRLSWFYQNEDEKQTGVLKIMVLIDNLKMDMVTFLQALENTIDIKTIKYMNFAGKCAMLSFFDDASTDHGIERLQAYFGTNVRTTTVMEEPETESSKFSSMEISTLPDNSRAQDQTSKNEVEFSSLWLSESSNKNDNENHLGDLLEQGSSSSSNQYVLDWNKNVTSTGSLDKTRTYSNIFEEKSLASTSHCDEEKSEYPCYKLFL